MGSDAEAAAAIMKLHNSPVGARRIIVNEARPMEARPSGGFGEKKSFAGRPGGFAPRPGDDKPGGRGDRGDRGGKRGGFDGKRGGFGGKKGGKGRRDESGDSW